MKVIYDDIVKKRGLSYNDFQNELLQKLNIFSTTPEEYGKKRDEWTEFYGRAYTAAFSHQKVVEAAFSAKPFGVKQEKILSEVAYNKISEKDAIDELNGLAELATSPLGPVVDLNVAELIVQIANQFDIFKEHLSVSMFNAFMAGTLTEPLKSAGNGAVSLFLHRLKEANIFDYGAFSKIGSQCMIESSSGDKTLDAKDIYSSYHSLMRRMDVSGKKDGKYQKLNRSLQAIKRP